MGSFENLGQVRNRYAEELYGNIIPFWERNCVDTEHGGYFTFLDRDGSVYDTDKFMWMQWRIVYMFATFYLHDRSRTDWLDIAVKGYRFLVNNGKAEDGNYYFALNREGKPIICQYNIFSEAFASMGAAALYAATGEEEFKVEAIAATEKYFARISNPKGRWNKAMPDAACYDSLAFHMILANIFSVLEECGVTDKYKQEKLDSTRKFLSLFWNKEYKILFENIRLDGSFEISGCRGREISPGHGLEALWFAMQIADSEGDKELASSAAEKVISQLEFGWDKKYGGIFYMMDVLGKPHVELFHDMKLWWVHNEAIIALLYAMRISGGEQLNEWFAKVDSWTWEHFPDQEHGEWFGYLNRQGEPTHMLKGGKWKTFFHLPRFLFKSIEQIDRIIDGKASTGE